MGSIRWRAVAAALGLVCLLGASGCEYKIVNLKLPNYFSAGVDEIWFWRLDERTRGYVRSGHVKVTGLFGPPGAKVLQYTMVVPDAAGQFPATSKVTIQGDAIIVALHYARSAAPGWFRVSARNRAGESPLSSREVYL
jgi:hypothetical protein